MKFVVVIKSRIAGFNRSFALFAVYGASVGELFAVVRTEKTESFLFAVLLHSVRVGGHHVA